MPSSGPFALAPPQLGLNLLIKQLASILRAQDDLLLLPQVPPLEVTDPLLLNAALGQVMLLLMFFDLLVLHNVGAYMLVDGVAFVLGVIA